VVILRIVLVGFGRAGIAEGRNPVELFAGDGNIRHEAPNRVGAITR
jgi:hypothetical protein